jgi:hypothetical protein
LVAAVAKVANTGLIEIKQIDQLSMSLRNAKDREYLKSISYKPLLPKGYTAVPFLDRIMIVRDHQMVFGVKVVTVDPLVLQIGSRKPVEVDRGNLLHSLDIVGLKNPSVGIVALRWLLGDRAFAEDVDAEKLLTQRIAFLAGSFAVSTADELKIATEIRSALATLDLDFSKIICKKAGGVDFILKVGQYEFHAGSSDYDTVRCSKTVTNNDSLLLKGPGKTFIGLGPCLGIGTEDSLNKKRQDIQDQIAQDYLTSIGVVGTGTTFDKDCTFKYDHKAQFTLDTLKQIKKDSQEFCRTSKRNQDLLDVDALNAQLQKVNNESRGIAEITQSLTACCQEDSCRAQALDVNIDLPFDDESKAGK